MPDQLPIYSTILKKCMLKKVKLFADGNYLPVVEHEIIAVKYPSGSTSTRFMFPDVPNLRESEIIGLEVYTVDSVTFNPDDGVTAVVAGTQAKASFITLQAYNGNNFYQQSPYLSNKYSNDGGAVPFDANQKQFQGQRINYPKSYIDYFGGVVNSDFVWLISVYYIKRSDLNGLMESDFRNQS